MKIGGVDPTTLSSQVFLVLPRGDQELIFRAQAVANMDDFEALCPRPVPPGKLTRDGWVTLDQDPSYQQILAAWGQQRLGYMVLKSLEPSRIEWDTLKESDPRTWKDWSKDLRGGGLSDVECHRVMNLVLEANCLDEAKLQKARACFLAGQESKSTSSGLPSAPESMSSGAPAHA